MKTKFFSVVATLFLACCSEGLTNSANTDNSLNGVWTGQGDWKTRTMILEITRGSQGLNGKLYYLKDSFNGSYGYDEFPIIDRDGSYIAIFRGGELPLRTMFERDQIVFNRLTLDRTNQQLADSAEVCAQKGFKTKSFEDCMGIEQVN